MYSQRMQETVERLWEEEDFSLVIASQSVTAPYAATLKDVPKVFEEIELTTLQEQYTRQSDVLHRLRYGLMWWKTRRFMARLLCQFDGCTVVSPQERANVLDIVGATCFSNPSSLTVVPNGVDLERYEGHFGKPKPGTLIFPGALTYIANFDAMEFFLSEVFPLVKARHPDVTLRITGKADGVPVNRLAMDENVTLTGYLEDIRPAVAQSWICVVPLQIGGGTRLKILEAMALGTAVVSTSKGAEGLDVTPGQDILIADEPTAFASAVLRLLGDGELRTRLAVNGKKLVRERYGWEQIGEKLDLFLHQVVRNYQHRCIDG